MNNLDFRKKLLLIFTDVRHTNGLAKLSIHLCGHTANTANLGLIGQRAKKASERIFSTTTVNPITQACTCRLGP